MGVRSVCLLLSKPSLIIQEKALSHDSSQSRATPFPERESIGMKVVEEAEEDIGGGGNNDRWDINEA